MADHVINFVIAQLIERNAQDIKIIDFMQNHAFFDKAIIATGTSSRHIDILATDISNCLRQRYKINTNSEGHAHSQWILIDVKYFIVNILQKKVRQEYNLEKVWNYSSPIQVS